MERLSVGVEEEFLVVDPATAEPVPRADEVLAGARPCRHGATLKSELQRSQVESASAVCTTLDELHACLTEARTVLADSAASLGLRLLPVGCPPVAGAPPGHQPGVRRERIMARHAGVMRDYQACGCHVHVGVPDRDLAVRALPYLRPWLATLLALSANSPFADGDDTGFDSWRMTQQSRFPGSGAVPGAVTDAGEYDRLLDQLVTYGLLVDRQMSFWLARASEHLPTLELRVADVGMSADDAVLQAGLTRALVAGALSAVADGRPADVVPDMWVTASVWRASRYGIGGAAVDLRTGRLVPGVDAVALLLDHVGDALKAYGDHTAIRRLAVRVLHEGAGAMRQRRLGLDDRAGFVESFAVTPSFDPRPIG
jgi:glutamate---cysteine ligase / carboxylate-amine ligase